MSLKRLLENFAGEVIFLQNKLGFYPIVPNVEGGYNSIINCQQYYSELYLAIIDVERELRIELKYIYLSKESDPSVTPATDKLVEESDMFHYIDDKFVPFSKRPYNDDATMPQTD